MRLLLGGGAVTVAGLLGLRRCAMTENKPMRAFESFFPEPIYVDKLGWEDFLSRWNNEAMDLVEELLLRAGLEGDPNETGLRNRLKEKSVILPDEILTGGMSFPLRSETEQAEAKRRLRLMKEAIPKIKETIPTWPKIFEWEALINGGLHYPRASPEMIEQAEHRLSVRFPRSYRDFLSVSNGWLAYDDNFLPVERVARMLDVDPGLVVGWSDGGRVSNISDEDYFQYDLSKQYPIHIREQYLPDCLLLSEHYGVSSRWYLLNPAIRFDDGEWEAWCLEPRIAGARRFRSFKAMMEWLYMESIAGLRMSIYDMT